MKQTAASSVDNWRWLSFTTVEYRKKIHCQKNQPNEFCLASFCLLLSNKPGGMFVGSVFSVSLNKSLSKWEKWAKFYRHADEMLMYCLRNSTTKTSTIRMMQWLFFGFRCCHFFANFLCDKNLRDIFFWLLQIIGTNMIFEEPESVKANCLDLGLMNEMLAVNKICEKRLYWHIENRERERLMEING